MNPLNNEWLNNWIIEGWITVNDAMSEWMNEWMFKMNEKKSPNQQKSLKYWYGNTLN